MSTRHVVVFGSGLAAAAAATTAADAGARVTLLKGRPATIGEFFGRLELFGPPAPRRPATLPTPEAGPMTPVAGHIEPNARMLDLVRTRPWHPYSRLDVALDDVRRICTETLTAMDAPLSLGPGAVAPTDAGTAVIADGLPASGWAMERARPIVWLGLATADAYPAEGAAALFAHQCGLDPRQVLAAELAWPTVGATFHPVAPLGLLDVAPQDAPAFADAVADACRQAPEQAVVLLPPILGRSFERAAAWCDHLGERTGRLVRERLPVEQPVMGLRLHRWLGAAVERERITVMPIHATGASWRGQGRIEALTVRTDGDSIELGPVDAVILANGRYLGGGLRAEPPLREALFGLPVYAQGQVLDTADTAPPDLLAVQVWDDHPVMTLGVGIDGRCRALGGDGRPRWSNVLAAGRLIGGTHPAIDGTATGVDLVSAAMAAREAVGASPTPRRSSP